jgi:ABC-type transporter Mla subunit MlaD
VEIPKSWGQNLGWTDLGRLLQAQNRMLEQLPGTLTRLTEVLDQLLPAVENATAAMSAASRVTARAESLVAALDEPIRRLIPAIERLTGALDNPAVDAVPETLTRIHAVVRPISDAVARGTAGSAAMRTAAQRAGAKVRGLRARAASRNAKRVR